MDKLYSSQPSRSLCNQWARGCISRVRPRVYFTDSAIIFHSFIDRFHCLNVCISITLKLFHCPCEFILLTTWLNLDGNVSVFVFHWSFGIISLFLVHHIDMFLCECMRPYSILCCKIFPTDLTTVRFLSSMDSLVSFHGIHISENFATVTTFTSPTLIY